MEIKETIERCLKDISKDPYHRYKSWDHCHKAFAVSEKNDRHALELAFYLASWGMYRGSSGLLQKNHMIHDKAVDILFRAEAQKIKCSTSFEVSKNDIDAIKHLKKELSDYYKEIDFVKWTGETKKISPTDTLISKILLGTLGCIPAYDQYFITGMNEKFKDQNKGLSVFDDTSINFLFDFIKKNKKDIAAAQNYISNEWHSHYPVMKIVDMYFWQIGFETEIARSKEKAALKSNL